MRREVLWACGIYKFFSQDWVLQDLDLHFYAGERVWLCGSPGSGKGVLARLLTGNLQPDGGEIRIDGNPVSIFPAFHAQRLGIRYVGMDSRLVQSLTLGENICLPRLPAACAGHYSQKARLFAEDMCRQFEITLDLDRPVRSLTLFEVLQAECLRALRQRARFIVFDRVFSPLSIEEQAGFLRLLERLKEYGICSLIVTAGTIPAFSADRILIMDGGRVTADLPPQLFPGWLAKTASDIPTPIQPMPSAEKAGQFLLEPPEGERITVPLGAVTGLLCKSPERYRWYEDTASVRPGGWGQGISGLSWVQLQTGYFPDLSILENLMMAAAGERPLAERLYLKLFRNFIWKEFSGWIPIDQKRWKEPLRHFGKREIEQVILHRQLLGPARILVLFGAADSGGTDVQARFSAFLDHAEKLKKHVMLVGRNRNSLESICTQLREI